MYLFREGHSESRGNHGACTTGKWLAQVASATVAVRSVEPLVTLPTTEGAQSITPGTFQTARLHQSRADIHLWATNRRPVVLPPAPTDERLSLAVDQARGPVTRGQ
jgi:hypothetical protein